MKTSYFARAGSFPGAIAISQGVPPGYYGHRYLALAPSWDLLEWYKQELKQGASLTLVEESYTKRYQDEVLRVLYAPLVAEELLKLAAPHEPILLCWEKPGKFCHRHLVAAWLGISVTEVGAPND